MKIDNLLQVDSEPMQLTINQVLMGKEGIIGVTVDKHGNARVEYDNTAVGPRDILQMVEVNKENTYECRYNIALGQQ